MVREGYKKTEVGEIPEDWEVKKLEEVVNQQRGITYGVLKPEEYEENGIPMIRIVNMKNNSISTSNMHLISKNLSNQYGRTILKGSEILISLVGTIGNVAYVNDNLIGYNVHRNIGVIPVFKNISPLFIMYYLISEEGRRQIKLKTTGGNQPLLNLGDLNKISVALPQLKEQEKIAKILSTLDCQIDDTDKLIEKTKELKKGLMQKLLTKGIGHKEFKKTEVGEIPVEWDIDSLKNCTSLIKDGTHNPPKRTCQGIPLLSAENIFNNKVNFGLNEKNISIEDFNKMHKTYKIEKGDVLLTVVGTIGRVAVVKIDRDFTVQRSVAIIKVNKKIFSDYLAMFLQSHICIRQLNKRSNSTAQAGLYLGELGKIKIVLPSLKEQEKIANILSSVDSQIEGFENKKSKLEHLKKGLMQQLLTGKIRTI